MNRLYVNIKVDREERPDLDHLYQTTHRLLSERGGGGWPLTVLLTPDACLFFRHLLSRTPRHGLPGSLTCSSVPSRSIAASQGHRAPRRAIA